MKSRFKPNNLFALLIALFLIAAGFVLAFIHRQSESREENNKPPVAALMISASQKNNFSA